LIGKERIKLRLSPKLTFKFESRNSVYGTGRVKTQRLSTSQEIFPTNSKKTLWFCMRFPTFKSNLVKIRNMFTTFIFRKWFSHSLGTEPTLG